LLLACFFIEITPPPEVYQIYVEGGAAETGTAIPCASRLRRAEGNSEALDFASARDAPAGAPTQTSIFGIALALQTKALRWRWQ
jgi:hypothetical protein